MAYFAHLARRFMLVHHFQVHMMRLPMFSNALLCFIDFLFGNLSASESGAGRSIDRVLDIEAELLASLRLHFKYYQKSHRIQAFNNNPLSMLQSDLASKLSKTISLSKDYNQKMADLFKFQSKPTVSQKHLELGIITNPKAIFNLIQSNFLSEMRESNAVIELKSQVVSFIKYLIDNFALNAKLIYEEAFLVVINNRKINIVSYLIKDIAEANQFLRKEQNEQQKQIYIEYVNICSQVFYQICSICALRTSQLKLITSTLTQFYYQQHLSAEIIGNSLRMLEAGLQQRNFVPYLYFIDSSLKSDTIRVQFENNRWPFTKGMTVSLWLNALKPVDFQLLSVKTSDDNQLIIKIVSQKVIVQCIDKGTIDNCSFQICDFPFDSLVALGIQLQPISQGIFKSDSYNLSVIVNGEQYKNVTNKIPKFQTDEQVTEFCLLKNFIGNLYSIIVTNKSELPAFQQFAKQSQFGLCRQSLVWSATGSKILTNQSIICLFNAQRHFQNVLLNYVCQKNHASFDGRVSSITYHKYGYKIIEIYLPFLYFLTLIKQKNEEWGQLFDLTFQHILQVIGTQNYEIESILLLIFFLEMNDYRISQSTLNYLYDCSKQQSNFYINILAKFLDAHALIARGLNVDQTVQPYEDPIQKFIFLFYLQSSWTKKWNSLQGFEGWWSPVFFQSQIDRPFNPKEFKFDPSKQSRVQWSVKNLVTKDYCKCFIEPIFNIPKYGKLSKYQEQYINKECFQDFKLKLYHQSEKELLICNKISNSSLDRIKNKILGPKNSQHQSPKKKAASAQIKEFSSQCVYIDILSIVQGMVRVTKEGYIVFTSRHKTSRFDRMCVKGHRNQQFLYLAVAFGDIRKVLKKRFNASNNGVQIKTKDGQQIMLYFYRREEDPAKRKDVQSFISAIQNHVKVKKDAYSNYVNSQKPLKWIDKVISNYQYLQWLNEIAGRSYCDMTQYPVLPWVYVANLQKLDESHKKTVTYRDLTKNMGLNGDEDRISHFLQKYKSNDENQLFSEYHFGTHYSSSAIIFNFLVRMRPYSLGAITFQSGKFDVADRLFYSYLGSWNNATTSPTDLRELIPQLYTLPQLFINKNNYDYGLTQDKASIDNVILPLWAKENPYLFVSELRKQLQSEYVSENINEWINIIYGYKQRGKDAVQNVNIFYPLTYENCIDLDQVNDENERESFETQIAHFGQNPSQIIGNNPHPKRLAVKAQWEGKLIGDANQLIIQKCFLSKSAITEPKSLFKSVFQSKNAILAIKFISDELFFVLRKHEYYLFQILSKQTNFLSKQQQVSFQLQSMQVSLDYKQLTTVVPITSLHDQIILVGGFYNGFVQIIFLKESKYNRTFKFPTSTISALQYHSYQNVLYVGDVDGYLRVYNVNIASKFIEFQEKKIVKSHDFKINAISLNIGANLITLCSEDGTVSLFNSYSIQIMRTIRHPTGLPITFAHITTNPLYAVVFYSNQNSTVYVYSINGQFLDSFCQKTGFIYNMSILKDSRFSQSLIYLNAHKEMYIWTLPFLKLKRKIKVKKDEFKVSCFQSCSNSKIVVAGTEDGALQIVANPQSY